MLKISAALILLSLSVVLLYTLLAIHEKSGSLFSVSIPACLYILVLDSFN